MENNKRINSNGFLPVYKEISDIIGPEDTYAIYKSLRGQQLTFPKRLYSIDFIISQVKLANSDNDLRKLAMEYDYTERYLKQLLKQQKGKV